MTLPKFCLLSWDLPIILWVTFRAYSLLFLPAKAMQNNFHKFEELVFCNLWFPVSGFRFPVSDSEFWFPIPDSGFRLLGLPGLKRLILHVPNWIEIMLNNLRSLEWKFKTHHSRSAILFGKTMQCLIQISRMYSFESIKLVFDSAQVKCDV